MHSEATKYRRFAPLPSMKKMNVRQPDLPPFLPEELIGEVDHVDRSETLGIEAVKSKDSSGGVPNSKSGDSNKNDDERPKPSKKEDQWDPFASFGGTVSSAIRSWSEDFNLGKKEKENRRLIETRQQLLALRESAANSSSSTSSSTTPTHPKSSTSGYALVTGASRGIGRALAVELARYGIPLILVARDIEKLKTVAKEIETYYNVPCCTIQADLAAPDCASRIYAATSEAGLKVDILVNNAGICTQGEMLDGEIDDSMQMIQVNVGSVVQLSQLYGRDMKKRRRGRILFVSSMSGALPGCPNVAVYAATKSFEKSLSSSLGREMERYGVGVTCLLPGAVKDTAFASRSDVEDAVCFHFPGYAKTPEHVAGEGIKAMMLGYPEVYPGLHNQLFIKFAVPLLPARLTTLAAEYAWSPLQWVDASLQRRGDTYQSWGRKMREEIMGETFTATKEILPMPPPSTSTSPWRFRRPVSSDLLPLPDTPDNTDESKKTTSQSSTPKIVDQATDNIVNENPGSTTGSKEVESVPSANVESLVDSEERIDILQKEEDASLSKNTIEGKDDGSSVDTLSSESETDATSTIPDVSSLALPSPAPPPPAPTPLAIFGFFGKESSTPSNSSRDSQVGDNTSHTTDAAISIDREHTHKDANTDSLNGDVVVEPFTNPNANITWYPIMDEHEYDFRDRRLDYAGMTLPSNH